MASFHQSAGRYACVLLVGRLLTAGLTLAGTAHAIVPDAFDGRVPFTRLSLPWPVTTMTLSDEGKRLFLASEPDNCIAVWNVNTGELETTLFTPMPRSLFSRNGRLYVANFGVGTVQVFDENAGCELIDEFAVAGEFPYHVTGATSGPEKTHLLVTVAEESADPRTPFVYTIEVIDCETDTVTVSREVRGPGIAEISRDGTHFVYQLPPFEARDAVPVALDRLPGQWHSGPPPKGNERSRQILQQPRGGMIWLGMSNAFAGLPLVPLLPAAERLLVGDVTRPVMLSLSTAGVEVLGTAPQPRALASVPVPLPPKLLRRAQERGPRAAVQQGGTCTVCFPQAAVVADRQHVFVLEPTDGSVWASSWPADGHGSKTGSGRRSVPVDIGPDLAALDLPAPVTCFGIPPNGSTLWIAMQKTDTLAVLHTDSLRRKTELDLPAPRALAFGSFDAYVGHADRDRVTVIGLNDLRVKRVIALGRHGVMHLSVADVPQGALLAASCWDNDRAVVCLADLDSGKVTHVNFAQRRSPVIVDLDATGTYAVERDARPGNGQAVNIRYHRVADLIASPDAENRRPAATACGGSLRRTAHPFLWAERTELRVGRLPASPLAIDSGIVPIPDCGRPIVYGLSADGLRCLWPRDPHGRTECVSLPSFPHAERLLEAMRQDIVPTVDHPVPLWLPSVAHSGDRTVNVFAVDALNHTRMYRVAFRFSERVKDSLPASSGKLPLWDPGYRVSSRAGGNTLIAQGGTVFRLDSAGHLVSQHVTEPPALCAFEREHWVAALTPRTLELLDLRTLEPIRSIDLHCDDAFDLAPSPGKDVSYVTVYRAAAKANHPTCDLVLEVDERKGSVQETVGVYGRHIAVTCGGDVLCTALTDSPEGAKPFHRATHLGDSYTRPILCSYLLSGTLPIWLAAVGGQPWPHRGLVTAPDGWQIVLPGAWEQASERDLAAERVLHMFHPEDIAAEGRIYTALSAVRHAAYHPFLDLIAVGTARSVELFRQSTEERLADAAQLLPREAEALHRLFFSGNGQAILLDCSDAAGERWLERVPFSPPRAIRNVLRRPPPGLRFSRDLAAKIRDSIAPRDSLSLEGLQPGRALEFQNRSLEERSLPALVRVTHSFGHGTGFFISKSGLVLTCAHVLPPVGDPIVLFRDPADGTVRSSHVRVVACDRKRDLALLQAYPRHGVPVIPVELKRTLSAGEPVTAYGMPPESETLPATAFTNGIVSAPVRLMQERTVVQTNIRAEPGASGGPLLDAHGRAVGVVSMRQLWGDMAFAVPQDDIAAFLAPYE